MNRMMMILVVTVLVCIIQIVSGVLSDCTPVPNCVTSEACDACRQAKCNLAKTPKLGKVDCDKTSPLIGGNQCCDLNTAKTLTQRRKRQAYDFVTYPTRQWPNPVSYAFDKNTSRDYFLAVIPDVLSYISGQTCLRFAEVDINSQTPHITFTTGSTCTAYVGKPESNAPAITANSGCLQSWGDMLYYICQSLGMFHQSQRPDRDNYITINTSNTDPTRALDFAILPPNTLTTLGLPYDLASIQQFPAKIYTSNGGFTIKTNDPLYLQTIGQMVELSFQDAKLLNLLYCKGTCVPAQLPGTCKEGGYQDPNDCHQCKCPDGFAGQFCENFEDTTDKSCGGMIEASLTEMNITSPGYFSPGYYNPHTRCVWHISAPKGGNIQMRFVGDFGVYEDVSYACYDWPEIRFNKSLNETGPRFCGQTLPTVTLVSKTSEVLIIFKSNQSVTDPKLRLGFQLALKIVNAAVCAYVTCANGGTCVGGICTCPTGFTGPLCEIAPPTSCTPNPCRNNGTCTKNGGSVTCNCYNSFSGPYCTKAPCGGCNLSPGFKDSKCLVPEVPARTCQVTDFIDSTSSGWFFGLFGCRTKTRVVTRNVTCTWAVCCDNAMDFGYDCGVLGWTDWYPCPVTCGGGIQVKKQFGTRSDLVGKRFYNVTATLQQNCNMKKCICNNKSWYECFSSSKCTPCNGPGFVESGDQCIPKTT